MEGVNPMAGPKDRDGETFSPRCELSSTTPKNLALKNPLSSHHKTTRNSDEKHEICWSLVWHVSRRSWDNGMSRCEDDKLTNVLRKVQAATVEIPSSVHAGIQGGPPGSRKISTCRTTLCILKRGEILAPM